jgi:hypothetical protein
MLNKISKIILFSSIVLICTLAVRAQEIVLSGLKEALDIAHKNLPDSISDRYDYNIKSAYYNWIYNHNRFEIFNEKKVLYEDFIVISEMHFKSGEINLISKALAETEYLKFESQYSNAQYDLLISENKLKRFLYIGDDILPENDSLRKYYLPENIIGESLEDSTIQNYSDFAVRNDYFNLVFMLKKYNNKLMYHEKLLSLAQQLIATTRLRYDNEDIEYFQYIKIMNNAIDLKLEYLKTLNLYNQTLLKIEMYKN